MSSEDKGWKKWEEIKRPKEALPKLAKAKLKGSDWEAPQQPEEEAVWRLEALTPCCRQDLDIASIEIDAIGDDIQVFKRPMANPPTKHAVLQGTATKTTLRLIGQCHACKSAQTLHVLA